MQAKPMISVAMATHNGAAFLREQLASIDAQNLKPGEIVVSDDCSTDETIQIVEEIGFDGSVPRRAIRNTSRGGVIENFRKAFRACKGDTLCYCDQDDKWHQQRLSILLPALEAPGVVLAYHPSRLMSADLAVCKGVSPAGIRPGVYQQPLPGGRLWGYGHQMVFKSAVWTLLDRMLNDTPAPRPTFAGNLDVMLIGAAGMLGNVAYVGVPLVDFRRHDRSTSPSGKEAPRSEAPMDRIEHQHTQISGQLDSVASWRSYIAHSESSSLIEGLVPDPAGHLARYLEKLRTHEDLLRKRLQIYERRGAAGRLEAFMSITTCGAYGNVYRGKLPSRLFVGDLVAALLARHRPT
jgi:glycosyltransferase involved in cell wall biosynthesis